MDMQSALEMSYDITLLPYFERDRGLGGGERITKRLNPPLFVTGYELVKLIETARNHEKAARESAELLTRVFNGEELDREELKKRAVG